MEAGFTWASWDDHQYCFPNSLFDLGTGCLKSSNRPQRDVANYVGQKQHEAAGSSGHSSPNGNYVKVILADVKFRPQEDLGLRNVSALSVSSKAMA